MSFATKGKRKITKKFQTVYVKIINYEKNEKILPPTNFARGQPTKTFFPYKKLNVDGRRPIMNKGITFRKIIKEYR